MSEMIGSDDSGYSGERCAGQAERGTEQCTAAVQP